MLWVLERLGWTILWESKNAPLLTTFKNYFNSLLIHKNPWTLKKIAVISQCAPTTVKLIALFIMPNHELDTYNIILLPRPLNSVLLHQL